MSIYRIALYTCIGITAIGAVLFFTDTPKSILDKITFTAQKNLFPYAVISNASTHFYNDDGSLSYTFESTKLNHFRPDGTFDESYTTIEDPNIVIFQNDIPWTITATDGRVDSDRTITLHNNVTLVYTVKTGETTTMNTSELTFYPIEKLARTKEAVTITSPFGTMSAIGMTADIGSRKIKLLSNVKGFHKPERLGQ